MRFNGFLTAKNYYFLLDMHVFKYSLGQRIIVPILVIIEQLGAEKCGAQEICGS